MGYIFQAEWWEKKSQWVFIFVIMAKEIGKGFGKEKWNFVTFIYENKGN